MDNIYCTECGTILKYKDRGDIIEVEPCHKCLKQAKADGRENGYDDGYNDGFNNAQDPIT